MFLFFFKSPFIIVHVVLFEDSYMYTTFLQLDTTCIQQFTAMHTHAFFKFGNAWRFKNQVSIPLTDIFQVHSTAFVNWSSFDLNTSLSVTTSKTKIHWKIKFLSAVSDGIFRSFRKLERNAWVNLNDACPGFFSNSRVNIIILHTLSAEGKKH